MTRLCWFTLPGLLLILGSVHRLAAQEAGSAAASTARSETHGQLVHRTSEQLEANKKAQRQVKLKVVVLDAAGNPVHGLKREDFKLMDQGQPQPIGAFEALGSGAGRRPDRMVLLLDTMNNTFDNVVFERKGIEAYLRQGDGHLQQPTSFVLFSDSGVKVGQPSLDGKVLIDDLKKIPTPLRENAGAEGAQGVLRRFQASIRVLTKLLAYEATLPGRATVVWIGPGWPLLSGANFHVGSEADRRSYFNAIVELTNGLRESGVTLDSLSPPALVLGGLARQDYYKLFLKPVRIANEADSGNLALPVIALQSGGRLLNEGKSIPQSLALCAEDAASYYLVTYEVPPAAKPDEYHSITVKLAEADLTAHTSAGYYAQP